MFLCRKKKISNASSISWGFIERYFSPHNITRQPHERWAMFEILQLDRLLHNSHLPVTYPANSMYLAYVFFSGPFLQEGDEQFQLFVFVWWLWAYFPVKILVRDGQQVGVVTNALTNSAPSSRKSCCVFVITFGDPSSLSRSSRSMKIMLGRLIDLVPLRRLAFHLRRLRVEPHCSSSNSKTANVEVFLTWLAVSCWPIAVPKRLTACWSEDAQAQREI